jgi:ribosomal protein L11 methyltransferase
VANLYRIGIQNPLSLEQAWDALEGMGIEILYGSEEEGQTELYAYLSSPKALSSIHWILDYAPYVLPPIDWEAQWAAHGHHFQDGYVHVDFSSFGRKAPLLKLEPGSGFGDLSHPTTRLMLRLLSEFLHKQTVIDIGCGSGILTLASAALGASLAYGIDIDQDAIEHSQQNANLNQLEKQCIFYSPKQFIWKPTCQPVLILMNMIYSEQQEAWSSLPSLHMQSGECLTSGIRSEERDLYLAMTTEWGWSLQSEKEEMGWLAFNFNIGQSQA